ncbi:hypothetical protein BDV98DRAFT_296442 [Pterulicium gracile]|uniref:Uncharacterized protein n=1 Tax=Pterulicium gracile TaxID=1884261 RepID=A0A5C3Q9L9_9AGAR|nr:hypothetical protein BDV98DRAFT_296442 [Pterula gracilis]
MYMMILVLKTRVCTTGLSCLPLFLQAQALTTRFPPCNRCFPFSRRIDSFLSHFPILFCYHTSLLFCSLTSNPHMFNTTPFSNGHILCFGYKRCDWYTKRVV